MGDGARYPWLTKLLQAGWTMTSVYDPFKKSFTVVLSSKTGDAFKGDTELAQGILTKAETLAEMRAEVALDRWLA